MSIYIHTFKMNNIVHTYEQELTHDIDNAISSFLQNDVADLYYETLVLNNNEVLKINIKDFIWEKKLQEERDRKEARKEAQDLRNSFYSNLF